MESRKLADIALLKECREALGVLEWLPDPNDIWSECPCCGAMQMKGHIPDGCQLGDAMSRLNERLEVK